MPLLASDILDGSAVLLDDPDKQRFTNEKLLPHLTQAYRYLESELINIGSRKTLKDSPDITVGGLSLDITVRDDNILDDLNQPIDLYRKDEIGQYIKMTDWDETERDLIENASEDPIYYYHWQMGQIRFNKDPGTIKIRYYASLRYPGDVSEKELSVNSPLIYPSFIDYLTKLTAAYAAAFNMENSAKAAELHALASMSWDALKSSEVKQNQKKKTRMRGFRARRRFIRA